MLSKVNATINANAQSVITDEGTQKSICSFNGYIDVNKQPSITKTIVDNELYLENKAIVKQDEEEFEEYLLGLV